MKLSDIDILKFGNSIQMAGAVYEGEGKLIVCMFPEDQGGLYDEDGRDEVFFRSASGEQLKAEILDMTHEDWKAFLFQTDVMQTEILTKASDGTLAKAIVRKSQRAIDQNVSWKVYRRDNFQCRYCGADDVPLTVDHIICWEAGGPSVEANLLTADKRCNKTRSNVPYEDWVKSPYYERVSQKLTPAQREANLAIVQTLDKIPRYVNARAR